jgi:hypothetical protein
MRKNRTIMYAGLGLVLLIVIFYMNGYRWSLSQLNAEINQRYHFNPASIVISKSTQDETFVVSKNKDWIVCRQYRKELGFLWRFNKITLDPIKVDPLSESYQSVLANYIAQCERSNQSTILSIDHPNINFSMKSYFNQEDIGIARGKNFEVKIIRLVKITVNLNNLESPLQDYYYDLLIAPITTELPIQLKNVIVYPTGKATDYFKNKQTYLYPAPDQYTDFVKSAKFSTWEKIQNLYAYEYILLYSNLTDAVQAERGMSTSDLDEGMKTIDVTISYNNTSETIRVSLDGPLVTISSPTDPLLDLDSNIKDIFESKGIQSLFGSFTTTKPKQEVTIPK